MFAFLAEGGLAVRAPADELDALYATDGVAPFVYGGMGASMHAWPVLPVRSDAELTAALSAAQRAYDAAI